jgi:CHAD domain-containing protein
MPSAPVASSRILSPPEALSRFLRRVLQEQAAAQDELAPDTVHDLRVALRRCRSLAEGFAELDGHPEWRQLRKAARRLQRGLAPLRDVQVMAGWVRRLGFTGAAAGAPGSAVAASLRGDERKARRAARSAVDDFPRKRWKDWRSRLPKRAERLAAGPASFADLALRRASEAAALERRWRRSGSQLAAHRLRIAVKRFRYTVESFLPEQYSAWGRDLRRMQDCLGEMHDLDVLRGRIVQLAKEESFSRQTRRTWSRRIERVRRERVERYRKVLSASRKAARRGTRAPILWDHWSRELYSVAWINPPKSAAASESATSAAGLRAEKAAAPRGRPLPPS